MKERREVRRNVARSPQHLFGVINSRGDRVFEERDEPCKAY